MAEVYTARPLSDAASLTEVIQFLRRELPALQRQLRFSAADRLFGRSTALSGNTSGAIEEIACTAAGRALLDDADAAAQRATLGLGTAALQGYLAPTTFTPTLTFGGAAVGLTYVVQSGLVVAIGKLVVVSIRIGLSAKGSSTGTALVSGLLDNVSATGPAFAAGAVFCVNMAGLTSSVVARGNGGAATINLYDAGATGNTTLDETNFTDTSDLVLTLAYSAA